MAFAASAFAFTAWFVYFIYFRMLAPVVERFGGAGLFFAILLTAYLLRNVDASGRSGTAACLIVRVERRRSSRSGARRCCSRWRPRLGALVLGGGRSASTRS